LVLMVLAGGVELGFRVFGHEHAVTAPNGGWQRFQPYVMTALAPGDYGSFLNKLTHQSFASTVRTNSLGFNDRHEFSLTSPYRKAANEKVVLFTGGSAAWGVGATATDRTVAGRMEHYLNALQSGRRYTVVNMAMAGWIAIQQSIGLQL